MNWCEILLKDFFLPAKNKFRKLQKLTISAGAKLNKILSNQTNREV